MYNGKWQKQIRSTYCELWDCTRINAHCFPIETMREKREETTTIVIAAAEAKTLISEEEEGEGKKICIVSQIKIDTNIKLLCEH